MMKGPIAHAVSFTANDYIRNWLLEAKATALAISTLAEPMYR